MIKRTILVFAIVTTVSLAILAQGQRGGAGGIPPLPQNTQQGSATPLIPEPNVTFDRLLKANQEPQNWLTYSGSYMSQRYSPLTQITRSNVKELELKWVFQTKSFEKHEVTPLVVDGTMYTVESPNNVIALNATTGKTIWTFNYTPDAAARNCCGRLTRGLAILGNQIFLATLDAHLLAIDARTGKKNWEITAADAKQLYSFTHAPLVIKDKVIVGTAGGEFGIRGFIAAYDAATGKEAWKFYTVPGPGEPGNESWSGNSWEHGGSPIWVTGSYDPETNLTYWGTGNPGPDWDGRARMGDNLYSCSVIALDADTGKLKWHYQFSPHNEFDWDATQVPVLADMDWQGRPRKVMLWANRSGMYYVLDRTNGEFLKGAPFAKVNWATGFDAKGRPNQVIHPTPEGTLVYPGNQGATNWYNPSYSPRTGLFYIPTWENSSSTYRWGDAPPEFRPGTTFAAVGPARGARGEETYSAVRAIDPKTGEKKWDYRMAMPRTDAGVMTTASDVLFSGGADGSFYALDARDGKMLWQTNLGPTVMAGPMTYIVGGKQYVSIMSGNSLFTFGLR
jgi:alcohol dehydrogenase (cytochrome c)